jgi:hypothetical protein
MEAVTHQYIQIVMLNTLAVTKQRQPVNEEVLQFMKIKQHGKFMVTKPPQRVKVAVHQYIVLSE